MKKTHTIFLALLLFACSKKTELTTEKLPIEGTWKLLKATTIRGDSSSTDHMEGKEMIKILNGTHFSFLNHDLNNGKDSTASFVAGGGKYELAGDQYIEHLQFCNFREWEGHDFTFTIQITGDTLVQKGEEEIEDLGIKQEIIETYVRVK
ncbi:MAG: hypothetical protein CMO01_26435 [Thalassobius sp.]|nr:hypothetical protein [Thalassovita sp.]